MSAELIVDFRPGVSEDRAREVIEAAGGAVRRRMRNDDPSLVRMLARVPSGDVSTEIAAAPEVARTEHNREDYGIR